MNFFMRNVIELIHLVKVPILPPIFVKIACFYEVVSSISFENGCVMCYGRRWENLHNCDEGEENELK